jgi:hypothetical protein
MNSRAGARALMTENEITQDEGNGGAAPAPRLLEGYIPGDELCRQLAIIPRTARKWRQSGEGPPFVKVGGAIYYPVAGFHHWLAKRVQGAGR